LVIGSKQQVSLRNEVGVSPRRLRQLELTVLKFGNVQL